MPPFLYKMVVSYPTNEAEAIKLFLIARKGALRVTIDRDQSLSIISIIAFERKTIGCFCPPRFWIGWEDFCNKIHYRLDLAAFEGNAASLKCRMSVVHLRKEAMKGSSMYRT